MPSALTFSTAAGGSDDDVTERMRIDSSGNVGIGSIPTHGKVEIVGSSDAFQLVMSDVADDDDTNKEVRMGMLHYKQAEEPVTLMYAQSSSAANKIYLGGGTGVGNHATAIYLATASSNTSTSTTTNMIVDNNSRICISNNDDNTYNTVLGYDALTNNGTVLGNVGADYNVAIGHDCMGAGNTTDATMNTAVGYLSLRNIIDGDNNVAIGSSAGAAINSADNNVAIGASALTAITAGNENTVIGSRALGTATTATYNVSIGGDSMYAVPAGQAVAGVVAIGLEAVKGSASTTTDIDNTVAVGRAALKSLTSGQRNTAVGFESLKSNTIGDRNTAVGYQALESFVADTDAHGHNTAVGHNAMQGNVTGTDNTAIGNSSAFSGTNNMTSGDDNTFLGSLTSPSSATPTNQTVIGKGATGTGNNEIALGNTSVSAIKAQVTSITAYSSDERTKKDIADYDLKGVDFIKELNLKTYIYKNPADFPDEIRDSKWDEDGVDKPLDPTETQVGLIAQEVEAALAKHGVGNTETYAPTQDSGIKTLTYGNLIFPLIKAVQELSARVEELEKK
jgi:hypothetical protein